MKILKTYRSENAAMPRNCIQLIFVFIGKSNKSIAWLINCLFTVSIYVSERASIRFLINNRNLRNDFIFSVIILLEHLNRLNYLDIFQKYVCIKYFVDDKLERISPNTRLDLELNESSMRKKMKSIENYFLKVWDRMAMKIDLYAEKVSTNMWLRMIEKKFSRCIETFSDWKLIDFLFFSIE